MFFKAVRSATSLLVALILGACAAPQLSAQPSSEWYVSEWQLWCIDVDGSNLRPIDTTPGCRCGSPVWSPDGTRIAYDVSTVESRTARVAVSMADASDRRILRTGAIPTWSPDGKLIAFQDQGLQVMNADGTGCETLPGSAFGLRWLPRGNLIASGAGPQIMLFDLATGRSRAVPTSAFAISHGYGISPDGRRFALGTPGNGLWLATMDASWKSATNRKLITTGDVYHTSWAPDGKHIVFAWRTGPKKLTQLYTLDVDSNDPPNLLPGIDTSHHNVNPSWSPDGKSIVFSLPGQPISPSVFPY